MSMITLRVYGIFINQNKEILVSDEYIRGAYFTKFPGGGLEFGEGTRDCLKREFIEEMNLQIEVGEHFYTTDFFQESAFRPGQQIVSIYYFVTPLEPISVPLRTKAFHFDEEQMAVYAQKQEIESFRFISLAAFTEESVSLPIDKLVARMVKDSFTH